MKNSVAIQNVARVIANRVRYHSPIVYDDDIDFKALQDFGIDINLPIFKFEKQMTKPLLKAFTLAKKFVNFNLVVTNKTNCSFALFLPENTVNLHLLHMINKMNINYKAMTDYNLKLDIDYLKIGGKTLDLKYNDFCMEKHDSMNGILISQRVFVCNGEFSIIELCNSNSFESEIEISYNKNLEKGNYFFKKKGRSLMAVNLRNKETQFLNTNLSIRDIFYSCVDGVENSCFACVKFTEKIKLKPFQKKCIYINFGKNMLSLKKQDEIEKIFSYSKKVCYENFDFKVFTIDKDFDDKINNTLPREIWLEWLKGTKNKEKEREYLKERQKIFTRQKNRIVFDCEQYAKLRQLDIFDGTSFRHVYIHNFAEENSLSIGNASFQNLRSFSLDKIMPKTQICLHFK